MFRIAPVVLLASLCSLTTAQSPKAAPKKSAQPEPVAEGTVINAPSNSNADQSIVEGIEANQAPGDANALPAAKKPIDEPMPFAGSAYLEVSVVDAGLHAFVHGAEEGYWGVFALSPTSDLTHSFYGLPPLLTDGVVMGFGYTKTQDLELVVPLPWMPANAIKLFGQAVIIDEYGYWASGIVPVEIGGPQGVQDANWIPAK
ncbi:MAG TPA: hypothetical protein VF384_00970 [Planctomycetota bacterium]